MRRKLSLLLFALLPMLMTSCGGTAEVIPVDSFDVESVHLSEKEIFLSRGEVHALTADVSAKSETTDRSVRWVSSNSYVATVDQNGIVTAGTTLGSCDISAITKIGGFSDYCKVTVTSGQSSEVTSLTLSTTTYTFDGLDAKPLTITPTIIPSTFSLSMISWTNSNSAVALMGKNADGTVTVTPQAEGTATITAKAGAKTANCSITVVKKEDPTAPSIKFDIVSKTVELNEQFTITATTENIPYTESLQFDISDTSVVELVSSTNRSATFKGKSAGSATISTMYGSASASCAVTVNPSSGDYQQFLNSFSVAGHVYLHYLRTTDTNYDPWAVWMWQKVPEDSEGTLWGATHADDLAKVGITNQSTKWMTKADVKLSGSEPYCDSNGQIVDIDCTRTDMKGGKTGVDTSFFDSDGNFCNRVGFLIVDQTKMTGGSHWKSDGGIECYIRNFNTKVNKTDKALHIYCIEGQVSSFTETAGAPIEVNPTITDDTGKYRSKNDITNLLRDEHSGQASPTSTSFLEDRPGVGYQIFVPAFADSDGDGMGDMGGIIQKIEEGYFDKLGVGVLWLTPIQDSGSYHGYDVTDYYQIDQKFASKNINKTPNEQYQMLIDKAHEHGLKVLMDMVINHTSKNNVLFTESQKAGKVTIAGQQYDARDMYLWKFKGDKIREWNGTVCKLPTVPTYDTKNVENSSDWYQDGSSNYYYYGKFGSGMAELNYSCEATRLYMEEMCKYWLSFGLDGFRLDAIKHIYLASELSVEQAAQYSSDYISTDVSYRDYYDDEKQEYVHAKNDYTYYRGLNVAFWKEFAWNIKSSYPNCFLVGENFDGWNERIAPFYEAIDSQFDFSTYYHLNELSEMPVSDADTGIGRDVKKTLELNAGYRSNHINGAFTSNHDISRMMNHAAGKIVNNPDNLHHGEVNSSNYNAVFNQAKYAAAVTMLTPGVSWIYYGDELGMTGNLNDKQEGEEDNGNNTDRWYRQPMRWATELGAEEKENGVMVPEYGFGGLKVKWDNINKNLDTALVQAQKSDSMLNWFRTLGAAKSDKRYPTYGYVVWAGSIGGADKTLAMQISDGTRVVNVFINNSNSSVSIPASDQMSYSLGNQAASKTTVAAHSFAVLSNSAPIK